MKVYGQHLFITIFILPLADDGSKDREKNAMRVQKFFRDGEGLDWDGNPDYM